MSKKDETPDEKPEPKKKAAEHDDADELRKLHQKLESEAGPEK